MKTLWQRAFEENLKVEEKVSGIQCDVVNVDGELYLDDGDVLMSTNNFCQDNFWIVNE